VNKNRAAFLKDDYVQGFPEFCGFKVDHVDYGVFHSRLKVNPEHRQQDGFVHAGVIATMADHTAGYSAYSVVSENMRILTIEFKINYFRPAIGDEIICKSRVINSGKKIIVAESEVYEVSDDKIRFISKAIITLSAVPFENLVE